MTEAVIESDRQYMAYAPNGKEIRGQLQVIHMATALISHFRKPTGGTVEDENEANIQWFGETDVNWDSQQPVKRGGELWYVDIDGVQWPASQINFKEME